MSQNLPFSNQDLLTTTYNQGNIQAIPCTSCPQEFSVAKQDHVQCHGRATLYKLHSYVIPCLSDTLIVRALATAEICTGVLVQIRNT